MSTRRVSIGWPHLPIHLPQDSDPSQTSLITPIILDPTVQDLVFRLETTQNVSRRRSSEGDNPPTPTLRILSRKASEVVSRKSSRTVSPGGSIHPRPELGTFDDDADQDVDSLHSQLESELVQLVLTKTEKEYILGPYAKLPLPPKGLENIGLSGYPHFPSTPIAPGVETNKFENLPPLLESPLSVSSSIRSPKPPRAIASSYNIVEVSPLNSPIFSPRLLPQSPLSIAVDSASDADESVASPPIFYQLNPERNISFNTA